MGGGFAWGSLEVNQKTRESMGPGYRLLLDPKGWEF